MIAREPSAAANATYDLIIVGGGIYGAMLTLEACRNGLQSLLLEQDDFGSATSYNSLRIIHGGFRYLQTLDLRRFFESVQERQWFLQTFPTLVQPLPCLMPLYGTGLRCSPVLNIALQINDWLSRDRNQNVRGEQFLPDGQIIDAATVQQHFPLVDPDRLQGGALWYDACMPDSQRVLMTILRWACALGGVALNYVKAEAILKSGTAIAGVLAHDVIGDRAYEYKAKVVVNASGPWCQEVATTFGQATTGLFNHSLAWNLLLNRSALSDVALAVSPKVARAKTYFLHPWKGQLLAGTVHNVWADQLSALPRPSLLQLGAFISDLNLAIPGLELGLSDVLQIFSGLLPATQKNSTKLLLQEIILDHARHGGCQGLYSVSGVKFTTARLVAEKTLNAIFSLQRSAKSGTTDPLALPTLPEYQGCVDYDWYPAFNEQSWLADLSTLVKEESVQHLDDLVFRRTSLGDRPDRALYVAPLLCSLFNWDNHRCQLEIARVKQFIASRTPS
jgi:glycerol-3-phosphate dehydrogenase